MSYDPVPGMRVVCIDPYQSNANGYGDEILPQKGVVYTIRAVNAGYRTLTILLCEIVNPVRDYCYLGRMIHVEPSWNASRFRPLDERSIDVFRQHLAPAPKEKEPA